VGETVAALRGLGLGDHAALLERAHAALEKPDYSQKLAEADAAFDVCKPSVAEALQAHLAGATDLYVDLV
jgi:hypothetical protein